MKVANAFSFGEHQILWLAGGLAVYRKPGEEELFENLDEAVKSHPYDFKRDLALIQDWENGYLLPGDESFNWPFEFQVQD